jgi:hypothetical protein
MRPVNRGNFHTGNCAGRTGVRAGDISTADQSDVGGH